MKLSLESFASNPLKSAALAYGVFAVTVVAYNLRWRHLGDALLFLRTKTGKSLPVIKVVANNDGDDKKTTKKPIVVLLHGMWHDAAWWDSDPLFLQSLLKDKGYTSYAIDLLPGERFLVGFSQTEIVADLERTLLSENGNNDEPVEFVLVGHSQGGVAVQSCLKNSPKLAARTKAAALLGTIPLGKKQTNDMAKANIKGFLWTAFTGKALSKDFLKDVMLLPSTDVAKSPALETWLSTRMRAPSDGLLVVSHSNGKEDASVISTLPTLVLEADHDVIFPKTIFKEGFDARFPNATHKIISNQAHCFMDPYDNNDDRMQDVLVDWLDEICS